jgi:hypothetical protein
MDRDPLLKATVGEWAISVPISLDPQVEPPPSQMIFKQNGKLARLFRSKDGPTTTNFTRVPAVMAIEEVMFPANDGSVVLEHRVHVVHNPFAAAPIEPSVFGTVPQLVSREGFMRWTDEKPDDEVTSTKSDPEEPA